MKNILVGLLVFWCVFFSLQAKAWVYSPSASITEIWEWQDDSPVYFRLSSGVMCYVPANEKNMYSLILSMMATGKKAHVHCHDAEDTFGGKVGHRVHRVIVFSQ